MISFPDLDEMRRRLVSALELVTQDRWVLGGLRDGRLRVIADSEWVTASPRRPRTRELSPLARRCLYERRPLTLSSLTQPALGVDDEGWEQEWPAILYAPVGPEMGRPVGLLIIGTRRAHWYDQEEIDYVGTLGLSLAPTVSCAVGPLGRLHGPERQVARLLKEGLSTAEIARALNVDRSRAQALIGTVLQKLSLKSRHQIRDVFPDRLPSSSGFLI
jgi:DNA-binding CsgD family transcriptional regulator